MKKTVLILSVLALGLIMTGCSTVQERQADAESFFVEGLAKLNEKELKEAAVCFTKAAELSPEYEAAYFARGLAEKELVLTAEAEADFTKVINMNGKSSDAWTERGSTRFFTGRYSECISDCKKALELDPKNAEAYRNMGCSYSILKDYDNAVLFLTKAINLDPYYEEAYQARITAFAVKNRFAEAKKDINKGRLLNINAPLNTAASLTVYEKSHSKGKSGKQPWGNGSLNKAYLMICFGNHTAAADLLSDEIAVGNETVACRSLRAVAFMLSGQHDRAAADWTEVIKKAGDHEPARFYRARCYAALEKYDEAEKDYSFLISKDPLCSVYYSERAYCYFNTEKKDSSRPKCIADCAKAVKLDPDNSAARRIRIAVYIANSDFKGAAAEYVLAEKTEKARKKCYENRNNAFLVVKNYPETADAVKRAVRKKSDDKSLQELDKTLSEFMENRK